MEHTRILPRIASRYMLAQAEANDPILALADLFEGIRQADESPPPQFMPFLVWQYGLGELSPYVPNLYDLVDEGIRWQRVRGTPAAIYRGLSWLGYAGTLEEEPVRRRKWNRFQIELDRIRDDDVPDLPRIDGIVSLSPPERSRFFRGFRDYDIRACETSWSALSRSTFSSHSGVRIEAGKARWSFGRSYGHEQLISEESLVALDMWIEPVEGSPVWATFDVDWSTIDQPWNSSLAAARRVAIYSALSAETAYIRFRRADSQIIGSLLPSINPVRSALAGEYQVPGFGGWAVDAADMTHMVVKGRTPFGAGAGQIAASAEVVIGATRAEGVQPGKRWLGPNEITGGVVVASLPVSIEFGLTVRECVTFLLALDGEY